MIGDIISGLGSLGGMIQGVYNSAEANKLNREQFEYSKSLQNQIFAREDTAVQRRVADLEKSGFSKWLAAGDSAAAGSTVSTNLQHTPVQGIENLMTLGSSLAQFSKMRAEIGQTEASTLLMREQVLTEAQKRLNMIADSNLSEAQKKQLEVQTEEAINSINWHWNNVNRPRDYKRSEVGGLAEDLTSIIGNGLGGVGSVLSNFFEFFR